MIPVEHPTTTSPAVNLMALLGKHPLQGRKAARTNTPAGLKHERSTVCRGQETLPQKLSFLAEQIGPADATLGRRHFGRAAC